MPKVAANRRNAQKSSGPKTLSGKAVASMNALKHGLCSRKPLIPGENEAEYAQFASDWVNHLRPVSVEEQLLAEQIIVTAWRIRRVPQLEAGLLAWQMRNDQHRSEPIHPFAMIEEGYAQLARIDRHQVVLERTLARCMKELRELQEKEDLSADSADGAEVQNEPTGVEIPREVPLTGSETDLHPQLHAPPSQG